MKKKVELGDEVIDIVSGFKGIAFASTTYLYGCNRITIAPKVKKDGTVGDSISVDEPQVKIIKKNVIKTGVVEKTGGYKAPIINKITYLK